VCRATEELSVAIVRGHTGTYSGLSKLIGVCTAYGTVEKDEIVTPADARPGDLVLFTRPVGLETLINFSLMRKRFAAKIFGVESATKLQAMVKKQSCVQEALKLKEIEGVHAMHDATEGGLTAALNEMAETSRLGFEIESEKLPVTPEMRALQRSFKLSDDQILSASCTGGLVAAVDPDAKAKVEKKLHETEAHAEFLGTFTKRRNREMIEGGVRRSFPLVADDPYTRILSGKA
jgi:hydrogenase maturation factor